MNSFKSLISKNIRANSVNQFYVSLSVLKVERKTVIIGSTVKIRWDMSDLSTHWFLFLYQSSPHLAFWKRYTWISSKGETELVVSDQNYRCEIRQFTLLGWKTCEQYLPKVRIVDIIPTETLILAPSGKFNYSRMNTIELKPAQFQANAMNLHIPNVTVTLPNCTDPTNQLTN